MYDYIVLTSDNETLTPVLVSRFVDIVAKLLQYKGSCICFPVKDSIILSIEQISATDGETEWFLRTLAGRFELTLADSNGDLLFADTDDNDVSLLEVLPAPDEESLPIHLRFDIVGIEKKDHTNELFDFFKKDYEFTRDFDGYTVYVAANSYLDIFYTEGDDKISFDIDLTLSGAGIYAEVVDIAEMLTLKLNGELIFLEDPRITYTADRDFDKLRRAFYSCLAHQFAFAISDDREGLPAYLGWGTDTFEPELIRGTLVTSLGRYDIERLYTEIKKYGFSYVCDYRFLTCNTPVRNSDVAIKDVLNLAWNTHIGSGAEFPLPPDSSVAVAECFNILSDVADNDKNALFPHELYKKLYSYRRDLVLRDTSKMRKYPAHFAPGYWSGSISYGFGHYLRRVKLPGFYSYIEDGHGEYVTFRGNIHDRTKIDIEINYDYGGDGTESPLCKNFVIASEDDIEVFDIGGSSVVRFVSQKRDDNRFAAEAEVYIRDELYRFVMLTERDENVDMLRDSLRSAVSVEDWYDEYIMEESPDPHAPGATFCTNSYSPPCTAFVELFPFERDRFESLIFPEEIVKRPDKPYTGSLPPDVAARLIAELFDKIGGEASLDDDKETSEEE